MLILQAREKKGQTGKGLVSLGKNRLHPLTPTELGLTLAGSPPARPQLGGESTHGRRAGHPFWLACFPEGLRQLRLPHPSRFSTGGNHRPGESIRSAAG